MVDMSLVASGGGWHTFFFAMTIEDELSHLLIWALSLPSSEASEGWDLTAVESQLSDFLVISSCRDPPSSLRGRCLDLSFWGIPHVFTSSTNLVTWGSMYFVTTWYSH